MKARLDLKHQPLKEQVIVIKRKAILCVVIGFVISVFRVGVAVIAVCGHGVISYIL
jgi:hypothetical protein